jgi:hypothetical protein
LEGRLKYFLRLLRWSLLGTAVGSAWGVSGTMAFSIAPPEVPGTISFPGPGNGQFAGGAGVVSSVDASGENGFRGLPHFWQEGPHFSRRYSSSGLERPVTAISDVADASCEIRSGDGLLWAFVTGRCSVFTSCEGGEFAVVQSDLEASIRSRRWNRSPTWLSERLLSWLVAWCNGSVSCAGCSFITGNTGGPAGSVLRTLNFEDPGDFERLFGRFRSFAIAAKRCVSGVDC